MKQTITILFTFFCLLSLCQADNATNTIQAAVVSAATDTAKQIVTDTKSAVVTNVNQALVEILMGAKSAGSEIYQASKTALSNAYDFVAKETPQVIQEFLKWRMLESCIYLLAWLGVAGVLIFYGYKCKKYAKEHPDEGEPYEAAVVFRWVFQIAAVAVFVFAISYNALNIGKIIVAPRVYIIDYVVSQIQGNNNNRK